MLRCKLSLLALVIAGTLGNAAAAKGAHPLAGAYSGEIYGSRLFLDVLNNGRVNGAWGLILDGGWIGSGRISNDGRLRMTLTYQGIGVKGKRPHRFDAIGQLGLDEYGSLVGVVQFEGADPQQVVLVRQ